LNSAIQITRENITQGANPLDFFENCITPSLEEVGRRFETLDIFLPEMVIAAEVVEQVNNEVINPAVEIGRTGVLKPKGTVLMATVQGDLHDIGKNMVGLMLKVSNFEVIDLGTNVASLDIVDQAEKNRVDIIGMSSLLTSCLPYIKDVCDLLQGKRIREEFSVVIGGAATTPEFAQQVGADFHGRSAAEAVEICRMLMES
jgi:5-methyltetrahydrofolate--homocysteine methyltransferase